MQHEIQLVMGDWSGDGHCQTETVYIRSNLSKEELKQAYLKGVDITGVHLTSGIARNYEDSIFPQDAVDSLVKFGFKPSEFLGDDEDDWIVYTDGFYLIWLFIAKIGNPELEWEEAKSDSLEIGGYGLFWS
jgi:hypothetical protein